MFYEGLLFPGMLRETAVTGRWIAGPYFMSHLGQANVCLCAILALVNL